MIVVMLNESADLSLSNLMLLPPTVALLLLPLRSLMSLIQKHHHSLDLCGSGGGCAADNTALPYK